MNDQWNNRYQNTNINRQFEIPRNKPKIMTASMVLGIIGGSLIGMAFFIELLAGFSWLGDDGYSYNTFPSFLASMARAFFYSGIGLFGIGIILALKKR